MKQRASTHGCLKYEGVSIDRYSKLYVGDIEIRFVNFVVIQSYHEHEDQDHVEDN